LDQSHVPEDMDVEVWERRQELDRLAKRIAELAAALVRPRRLPEPDLRAPRKERLDRSGFDGGAHRITIRYSAVPATATAAAAPALFGIIRNAIERADERESAVG
jgi:hypothetical protein